MRRDDRRGNDLPVRKDRRPFASHLLFGDRRLDQSQPAPGAEEKLRLEGAIREWSPGFETHRDRITIRQSQATVAHRTLRAPVMELTTIARNDTGLTVIVFDAQGFPVRERRAVIIPTQQVALEPNEVIKARILLEDIKLEVERAKIRVEVTWSLFD